MITPCTLIQSRMGELFSCAEIGNYVRVRTPFMYPDGDFIDVFWERGTNEREITLSDLGETIRWLKMQTIVPRRSSRQSQLISDICLTHGIEFYRGMLQVRCRSEHDVASAVTRLSQAALRVSDLWFTFRNGAVESVIDEVADFLSDHEIAHDRNVSLPGRSGRTWQVNFFTRTPKQSCLVYVLGTGSRGAARRITEHVVAAWYDLSHYKLSSEPKRFISLFDDTSDVWSDQDFRQLEELSDVARWSEPETFAHLLNAA